MAKASYDWTSALNKLAGTTGLDGPGAANVYAGTTGLDLLGALNAKAGRTVSTWQDLASVCNTIAGTTGLDALGALNSLLTQPFSDPVMVTGEDGEELLDELSFPIMGEG